jgi:hypothetical protein
LVEEDVLAVAALCREVFKVAVAVDAVLLTQLLPELLPDAVAALARLERYYLSASCKQLTKRVASGLGRTWAWCCG